MNLRDYISTYGGVFGLLTFGLSVILFFVDYYELALIVNTITLLTLNPYHTYQAYWEKRNNLFKVSPIWHGKFGSLINLVFLVNLVWYSYLVYVLSKSFLVVVLVFLFMVLVLPRILIYFMIKKDEYGL